MRLDSIFSTKKGLVIGLIITAIFAYIARYLSVYTVNENELDYYEEKEKERIPFPLGCYGSVSYVYYTNDDIVYICEVNEENGSIDRLKSETRETRQNCKLGLLCDTKANVLFGMLKKYEKGLKVIYKGKNDSAVVRFSPDEVREIATSREDPKKTAFGLVETYTSEKNAVCPLKSNDTLTLVQMKLDKSALYYYYTVNENPQFSLESLKEKRQWQELLSLFNDPGLRVGCWKAAIAGLGVQFIFTSAETGRQKCFSFENVEITDRLKNAEKQ